MYARGNDRKKIFLDEKDRLRFLVLLYVTNNQEVIHLSDYLGKNLTRFFTRPRKNRFVDIGAYCLMPNHFHLLIRARDDGGTSSFMLKLMTAYSMYFNKKHQKTGGLFERPFKAQHVSSDTHLKYLFAYVHLNPVKIHDPANWGQKIIPNPKKARDFLNNYPFSSAQHYFGKPRLEDAILNKESFPEYFQNPGEFSEWVYDWISYDN